jgi:hypothetical protein
MVTWGENGLIKSGGSGARGCFLFVAIVEERRKDTKLYQHIKTGMREYHCRERRKNFWRAKSGELLFETAHLSGFSISHFAESRVRCYFKDIDEYGSTASSQAPPNEFFESY